LTCYEFSAGQRFLGEVLSVPDFELAGCLFFQSGGLYFDCDDLADDYPSDKNHN
jgi:hypothetical protein